MYKIRNVIQYSFFLKSVIKNFLISVYSKPKINVLVLKYHQFGISKITETIIYITYKHI